VDELRWPIPVRPGDSISVEIEILSITPSKSKPQFGVVRMRSTGRNQSGEVVLSMITSVWVPRKPA
jgi:acyl dehydratase